MQRTCIIPAPVSWGAGRLSGTLCFQPNMAAARGWLGQRRDPMPHWGQICPQLAQLIGRSLFVEVVTLRIQFLAGRRPEEAPFGSHRLGLFPRRGHLLC